MTSLLETWMNENVPTDDVDEARAYMRNAFRETRTEVQAIREARPYPSALARMELAAGLDFLHDIARSALRRLNAKKLTVPTQQASSPVSP